MHHQMRQTPSLVFQLVRPCLCACAADGQQEVPFEDNIVAQLLSEYQDTLEDEMHITPARAQPQAPPVVVSVTDIDNQAPASARHASLCLRCEADEQHAIQQPWTRHSAHITLSATKKCEGVIQRCCLNRQGRPPGLRG